jgi:hypothetical protein
VKASKQGHHRVVPSSRYTEHRSAADTFTPERAAVSHVFSSRAHTRARTHPHVHTHTQLCTHEHAHTRACRETEAEVEFLAAMSRTSPMGRGFLRPRRASVGMTLRARTCSCTRTRATSSALATPAAPSCSPVSFRRGRAARVHAHVHTSAHPRMRIRAPAPTPPGLTSPSGARVLDRIRRLALYRRDAAVEPVSEQRSPFPCSDETPGRPWHHGVACWPATEPPRRQRALSRPRSSGANRQTPWLPPPKLKRFFCSHRHTCGFGYSRSTGSRAAGHPDLCHTKDRTGRWPQWISGIPCARPLPDQPLARPHEAARAQKIPPDPMHQPLVQPCRPTTSL